MGRDQPSALTACLAVSGHSVFSIETEEQHRRQGQGTIVMTQLCHLADQFGVVLALEPNGEDDDGPSTDALVDWYSRFGFRGDKAEMIREPG